MKKSTLLSLLTAGAVIATSAGTFAAWDTTEATSTGSLSFDSPVTIATTSTPTYAQTGTRTYGEKPVATGNVEFNVSGTGNNESGVGNKAKLKLTAVVKDETSNDIVSGVDVTFKKGSTDLTDGVDDKVTDASNTYTVTLTPSNNEATEALTKSLKVEVTGTLENNTVTP
ncbi:hypothetical protein MKA58_07685 [[Clostridium] innocuum]|nr:hypothetical protein [[Clostridium] innocuum]